MHGYQLREQQRVVASQLCRSTAESCVSGFSNVRISLHVTYKQFFLHEEALSGILYTDFLGIKLLDPSENHEGGIRIVMEEMIVHVTRENPEQVSSKWAIPME